MGEDFEEIGDRFAIVSRAATGGMGVVYRARDAATGTFVAVKLLHGGAREEVLRFEREAAILAGLAHPAIVRYVAHGVTASGKPYLAMSWVDGETLDARLARAGVSIAETVELGRRLAGALGHAHARGVIHRDLKPANIILPDRELARVSLLDFGVARGPEVASLTETGTLIGTPAYMAPEQARGERGVGPAVDVFALACVLYECATGRRVFEGRHVLALIAKIVLWDPPRLRELEPAVPAALDDAIARMLAKDPKARPRDGNEVAALLGTIEVAPGPSRGGRTAPAATAIVRKTPAPAPASAGGRVASIVVATPPAVAGGIDLPGEASWPGNPALSQELARLAQRWEVLRDGSILAVLFGAPDRGELAARAVRCARAVQHAIPSALIAVATGEIGDGDPVVTTVGALLDDTVGALAREAMAMVFAGVTTPARPQGAIRIDERTAGALPADAVHRVKSAWYARAEWQP